VFPYLTERQNYEFVMNLLKLYLSILAIALITNNFLDKGSQKVLSVICLKMMCLLVDIFGGRFL